MQMSYTLTRSGFLSYKELGVLEYITSYSTYCIPPSLPIMAKNLQMSVRTLRRIIKTLVFKGVVEKTYVAYHKVMLVVVSLKKQAGLIVGNPLFNAVKSMLPKGTKPMLPKGVPVNKKETKRNTQSGTNLKNNWLGPEKKDALTQINDYREWCKIAGLEANF